LRHALPTALAFLALAAPPGALAQPAPPAIAVTGTGSVYAAPDTARIQAGVVTEAARASEAVAANTAAMQKVFAALDAAGIEKKYVQTSRFDVSPVYADGGVVRGRPQIAGYQATNQVSVEVRGVDRVGAVLDALVGAGANEMGGVSFEIAEPAPLLDEARRKAVADARRKADLYARETGTTLGRVLRVDETGGGPGPMPVAFARMEKADMAAPPPMAPGQLEIAVTVAVTWSLAP
jgi:uncharacterized protein YggE